jgi:nucleotide-binding universal stress UspA family protein
MDNSRIDEEATMNITRIVVGVDESESSRNAARWAAVEAERRRVELAVVHAYDWRVPGAPTAVGGPVAEEARVRAERVAALAAADATAQTPGVDTHSFAILGSPGRSLLGEARPDTLLVVGNRGRGGFSSLVLGSVSQQVATHAAGAVVVVRGRERLGPVVVGVDGSEAAEYALEVAFDEASIRGAGIVAVHVYTPASPTWGPQTPVYVEDVEERRTAERALVLDAVAPWREKFPDVGVETMTVAGNAAEVLSDVSSTASIVVVGTRGRGGFAGLLLGSVGQQLLHHADSPVLIARRPVES